MYGKWMIEVHARGTSHRGSGVATTLLRVKGYAGLFEGGGMSGEHRTGEAV